MKALTHITAGRIAIRALLIAVVLTAGIAGTVGMAAAEPIDGKGNDVLTKSLDGKGNDVYPPPARYSLDGKGNDPFPPSLYASRMAGITDGTGNGIAYMFPINNVTLFSVDYAGRGGGSGKASL